MNKIPPIRCAQCNAPVKAAFMFGMPWDHHDISLTVHCHGESERMIITGEFLRELGPEGQRQLMEEGGVAFQNARISDGNV